MRPLIRSLADHPMALLRGIAEVHGIEPLSNVREELAAQLGVVLAEPELQDRFLERSSPEARAAWQALQAHAGRIKVPAFSRSYGALRPVGPGKAEREALWRTPANATEELWYAGLLFKAFAEAGGGTAEYYYIPDDLLRQQPPHRPPYMATLPPAPSAGERFLTAGNSLAVDVCALLLWVKRAGPRANAGKGLREGEIERLLPQLLLPDPLRAELLLALALDAGWLETERSRLAWRPAAVEGWLRAGLQEQTTRLFELWRSSRRWNDLRHTPGLRIEGEWSNDPLLAREALLALLRVTQPGHAYAVEDVVARIRTEQPDFQRPEGNYEAWYLRDAGSGQSLMGFEAWDQVEGRLLRFLLAGPLFWLGAVDIAAGANGAGPNGRYLFRPAAHGAAWIGGAELPEPEAPGRLQVAADYTVTAPLDLPLWDRFRLLRFTERADEPYVPGQPTRHRITRAGIDPGARRTARDRAHRAVPAPGQRRPVAATGQRWAGTVRAGEGSRAPEPWGGAARARRESPRHPSCRYGDWPPAWRAAERAVGAGARAKRGAAPVHARRLRLRHTGGLNSCRSIRPRSSGFAVSASPESSAGCRPRLAPRRGITGRGP